MTDGKRDTAEIPPLDLSTTIVDTPVRKKKQHSGPERRWERRLAEYRALLPVYGPQGKVALAKAMGVSVRTIGRCGRDTGLLVGAIQKAAREAARKESEELSPTLTWSALQLFDELAQYFVAEKDRPAAEDPLEVYRTWVAWRVFLAAAFAEPAERLEFCQAEKLTKNRLPRYPGTACAHAIGIPRGAASLSDPGLSPLDIFRACTGRMTWPVVQASTVALVVGRRGGKSYITAIIGIFLACCRRYTLNLGTRGMVVIMAKDKEQAGVIRNYVLSFLKAHPKLAAMLKAEPTQKLIELHNGITIEVRAVGDAKARGYTIVAALCDEIAFWSTDENAATQDRKVIRSITPAMLNVKGAMLVMLSSPYARKGELFETHKRAFGKNEEVRTLVWQADTLSMRPTEDPDVLDKIRAGYEEDPESAKSEYGATFRSDLESLFARSVLEARCVDGIAERPYKAGYAYMAFVDTSSGSGDGYALAIAHYEMRKFELTEESIPVLDFVKEWPSPFDPEAVTREAAEHCKRYGVRTVVGDAFAGNWPRDVFKKSGVGYEVSERFRNVLYLDFLPRVNGNRVELLDKEAHRKMLNQMANLERRMGRTGRDNVDHPAGHHDDIANAVAGVLTLPPPAVAFTGTLDIGVPRLEGIPSWRR